MQKLLHTPDEVREYLDKVLRVQDLEAYAHILRDKLLEKIAHISLALAGNVDQKFFCKEEYGIKPCADDIVQATEHLTWVTKYLDLVGGRMVEACISVEMEEPIIVEYKEGDNMLEVESKFAEKFVKRWRSMFHPRRLLSLRKYVSKHLPLPEDKEFEELLKRYNVTCQGTKYYILFKALTKS